VKKHMAQSQSASHRVKADDTELLEALRAHQDELSRRYLARIEAFWETHLPADDVARGWVALVGQVETEVRRIPAQAATALGLDAAAVAALRDLLDSILAQHLTVGPETRRRAARPPVTPEPVPTFIPSTTLPEARAQATRLKTMWMGLPRRVARYPGPHQ
jgi:hypothetical protein